MNKNKIGERLQEVRKKLFGVSREKFAEKLGLVGHQIRDIETGRVNIPGPLVKLLQSQMGISEDWLLRGDGDIYSHPLGGMTQGEFDRAAESTEEELRRGHAVPEKSEINVHKGVMMTTKVLSSQTGYANALWHNLKSFDAAVDREAEVGEMKEMMAKLAEDNQKIMAELAEMKRVVAAPTEEAKKRDEAANS